MADSATIIAASLDSSQLEQSINTLVSMVAEKTKEMANNFTGEVKRMEDAVKNLGNIKINSGSAADGGSSRRTTVLKKEEEQGKAVAMSYDAIAASNKRASDSAVAFLDNERQAYRERQREIEYEIKKLQTRYNSIKINPIVTDDGAFKIAVDNIKQKIQEARQKLQEVPPTSMLGKQFSQELQNLRAEMNNLIQSRKAFEAQGKISNLQAEYAKISESLISLGLAYRRVSTEEKLLESAINNGTNVVSRYGDSADKAYQKMLKLSFDRAMNISTGDIDLAMAKLERLQAILADERFMGVLSPSQIKRARAEIASLGSQLDSTIQQSTQKNKKTSEEEISATRRRVEAERQAAIQNGVFYQNLRQEMRSSGIQAQETSRAIMRDMFEQLNSGSKEPIRGLKELEEAIVRMRRAFFEMDSTQKQSPLGVALENDIKKAQDAISLIQRYNRELSGVQFVGKDTIGSTKRSYDELKNTLSQLTKEYYQLNKADRDAAKGTELRDKIHAFNREIRDVQRTMARPTSLKKALGLDESTLDRINDKLQALRLYKGGLKITDPKQLEEMKQVDLEINRLQNDYNKLMAKNSQMIASNNALGRSWNYMKNRLAFYFTVGASTQFIKNLIEVRSQYEMNERALGILINSAERGTQIFNELSQMALVSPYTLIELSNAAKQLTAYDIAAKDVVDTTRRLADMASAVGVPMERLTYALGQIKAYGYLNSRDARMFANAGIPLVRELSKYYSELEGKVVSVGDVYDRMKKKAIDFNSVMAVVTKMTDEGGKFFDFQAKMADTLKVRLANLTLAWNNMLNDIGASQQGVLTSGIGILRDLFLHWQDIYGAIQRVVLAIGLWKGAQALALLAMGELNTKMGIQVLLGEKLQTRLSGLAGSTKNLVSGYAAAGAALLFVIADAIMTYQRNAEEIEKLNKVIVDGAKESSNAIYEFIESAEMSYSRLAARTGKLPKPDAEKTWDALREQIELSAISAKDIIPELIKIEDLNERVTKAFNLAERVAEANNKLIDLEGKLDISQDSILFGLFGEGLVEDIDDFNERLKTSAQTEELYFKSTGSVITDVVQGLTGFFNDMKEKLGSSTNEAEIEIKNFAHNAANAIKDELGEEGLKDSIQVNEAVSRVLKGIEQQFPQIKGQGKALFESIYNDIMANEFNGAVDKQAYYYKLFLERLKKDHGSAFQGVTEDIDRETFRWSDAQMKAIQKTADRIKEDIPEAYQDSVTEILNDLNSREFKMRIVAEFATTSIDDINKAFRKRFIEAGVESVKEQVDEAQNGINKIKGLSPWAGNDEERKRVTQQETENLQKYGFLMKKANESDLDYQERISKERQKSLDISATESKIIAANTGKEEEGAKVVLASAIEQKKAADERLKAISDVAEWGGYDFSTKKENSAATKAQHAAETELQKALKDELQLIDKVRSQYKKLTDAGATDGEALTMVTNQFANSLAHVNNVLGKNGIPLFDISKFAGTDNPNALLDMLKLQLDSAKIAKNIKPEEIKELEVKYSEIVVDAKAYNLTKITKGLNNELDKLKDEYELAVSLDADPELGGMFADWMGIDINELPRTASEYAERASKELNKYLKQNKADVEMPNLLNVTDDDLRAFEENKILTDKQLEIVRKSVQQARDIHKKEVSDQIKDWEKLFEKYAEYEARVNKIQNDAAKERVTFAQRFGNDEEKSLALNLQTQILAATDPQEKQKLINQLQELIMSIAGNDSTKVNLAVAIDTKNKQDLAKSSFEEFQKSPEWIVATGNLAGLTDTALKGLISSIEDFKKKAKNLSPKQIKEINKALRELDKERKKNNPFKAFAISAQNAKERMEAFDESIKETEKEIDSLSSSQDGSNLDETGKKIMTLTDRLRKLREARDKAGDIDATEIVANINGIVQVASQAAQMINEMVNAMRGDNWSEAQEIMNDTFSVIEKGGQGAMMGAQIGGGWGAIIGAVAGVGMGLFTALADNWDKKVNAKLKESEIAVKRLELAYVDLEHAIDKAYGTSFVGSKRLLASMKELQLAELERQIELERSRDAKHRDESKITDLQKQVKELRYEIEDSITEITNELLGGEAGSFAEGLVEAMIDSFKKGEDYMKVFEEKFEDMIDNMIMKSIVSKVVAQYIDRIWDDMNKNIAQRSQNESDMLAAATKRRQELESMDLRAYWENIGRDFMFGDVMTASMTEEAARLYGQELAQIKQLEDTARMAYNAASEMNDSDISNLISELADIKPELGERLREILGEYYKFGETSNQELSALQQGIQGITETTAGALEAYMNGVSQQVYYQSDLMTQIRDAVISFNMDVQVASMSQILLQLRSSYEMQTAIHALLSGWNNPAGNAIRVEMI